jgi:hypothetical protein
VNNPFADEIPISHKDLLEYLNGISLRKHLLLRNILTQIPMGTILEHEIVVVRCFYDLKQLNNMLVLQRFVNGYLRLQHLNVRPAKLLQVYHLYRISLVRTKNLHTFENATAVPLTEFFIAIVLILPNSNL